MRADNPNQLAEGDLQQLEQKVDSLIRTCSELLQENHSLKNQQEQLMSERATLIEKTESARTRVEAIISRLKSLETGS